MMSVMLADESFSFAVYTWEAKGGKGGGGRGGSDVEVLHVQGVVLDELAAGRDLVAHEEGEEGVGLGGVADVHLEEPAVVGVHRRFVELLGVHFPETLVALDGKALAAVGADLGDDLEGREE